MKTTNKTNPFTFYKEEDGRWYVNLPTWTGSKAELEMVAGADKMLDVLAQEKKEVTLDISLYPIENFIKLSKIDECDPAIGGATYSIKDENNILPSQIWLCDVTKFVFGYLPENIYLKTST
jgi:hypothetical protein